MPKDAGVKQSRETYTTQISRQKKFVPGAGSYHPKTDYVAVPYGRKRLWTNWRYNNFHKSSRVKNPNLLVFDRVLVEEDSDFTIKFISIDISIFLASLKKEYSH